MSAKSTTSRRPPLEKTIQKNILAALRATPWIYAWRNNVGNARTLDGKRRYRFGLAGSADITGILAPDGRRLEIEVKRPGLGQLRPAQVRFGQRILDMGGIYIVATSVEDVFEQLRGYGYPREGKNGTRR